MDRQTDDAAGVINKMSWRCLSKLPPSSVVDLDDLKQEGWIIDMKCQKLYDAEKGAKYTTFLCVVLIRRYKSILVREWRKHKTIDSCDHLPAVSNGNSGSPEKHMMMVQAIQRVSEVSPGFADMVVNGIPEDLFHEAKQHVRQKRFDRGWSTLDGKFELPLKILREFFMVDTSLLRAILYNTLEIGLSKPNKLYMEVIMSEKLETYGKVAGVVRNNKESDEAFQGRILDAIRSMNDTAWDAMTDECKTWSNQLFEDIKKAKAAAKAKKPAAPKNLKKAQAAAKAKASKGQRDPDAPPQFFRKGTNGDDIFQIVLASGKDGITEEDVIKAATAKPIKSTNIAARVKDVLKMASAMPKLAVCGLLELKDGKYYAAMEDKRGEAKAEKPAAPAKAAAPKAEKPAAPVEKAAAPKAEKPAAPAKAAAPKAEKPAAPAAIEAKPYEAEVSAIRSWKAFDAFVEANKAAIGDFDKPGKLVDAKAAVLAVLSK